MQLPVALIGEIERNSIKLNEIQQDSIRFNGILDGRLKNGGVSLEDDPPYASDSQVQTDLLISAR